MKEQETGACEDKGGLEETTSRASNDAGGAGSSAEKSWP